MFDLTLWSLLETIYALLQVAGIAGVDEAAALACLASRGWSVEAAIAALFGE